MKPLEDYKPRKGLSIPSITVLDSRGHILVEEQRKLFRHNIQKGVGADIVFGIGTNGEWKGLENWQRQELMRIEVDEIKRQNVLLGEMIRKPVEAWVQVTGNTKKETLENISLASEIGADAGVIAPLSIIDLNEKDIVTFFQREITPLMMDRGKFLPIFLYDNADISVHRDVPHIHTRDIKMLSRLPYIFGIKVTASKKVLGNYIKAASHFKEKERFGIYIGNAMLAFDIFRPKCGIFGKLKELWNKFWIRQLPIGVVAGYANVFPREWQLAWQSCVAGDIEQMELYQKLFHEFRLMNQFDENGRTVKKTIACMKHILVMDGVISSQEVAKGTPHLTLEEEKLLEKRYSGVKDFVATLNKNNAIIKDKI